jgi:hypothetical protein
VIEAVDTFCAAARGGLAPATGYVMKFAKELEQDLVPGKLDSILLPNGHFPCRDSPQHTSLGEPTNLEPCSH